MKSRPLVSLIAIPLSVVFLPMPPAAQASTIWYVNGVSGSDSNACTAAADACKTIGHAISLVASGDSIMVAAATYSENLTIGTSLTLVGSSAATTTIDGGGRGTVVVISSATAHVVLSQFAIRNGHARYGAGINNSGTLTILSSIVRNNHSVPPSTCFFGCNASGGGILNTGSLTINNSTVSGNTASTPRGSTNVFGGGIANSGTLTINNSTVSGNSARITMIGSSAGYGGGIGNGGSLMINNSTITGNSVYSVNVYDAEGGGIWNQGTVALSNATVSANSAPDGAGIDTQGQSATIQNTIIANNTGGNCYGGMTSHGYNMSSDNSCNFTGPGDLNSTDPKVGSLGAYGGPTETIPLLSGSPAIDAGNPNGCTDNLGHLLKTDQRGMPRPDREDTRGCDIGAYESQSD